MRLEDVLRKGCERYARKLPTWVITVEKNDPYLARHYVFQRDTVQQAIKKFVGRLFPVKGEGVEQWFARVLDKSLFVHEFLRGDSDSEYHNHPWEFSFSLILAGGYREDRLVVKDGDYRVVSRTLRPGMINVIRKDDFHRVSLLDGKTTWTLFVAGRRTGEEWGFLDLETRQFLPWPEHVRRRARSAASYSNSA